MQGVYAGCLNYRDRKVKLYGAFPSERDAREYVELRETAVMDMFLKSVYFIFDPRRGNVPLFKADGSSVWTRCEETEVYVYGEEREGRLEDYIWPDDAKRLIQDAAEKLDREQAVEHDRPKKKDRGAER